jgi:hypothetical protein
MPDGLYPMLLGSRDSEEERAEGEGSQEWSGLNFP